MPKKIDYENQFEDFVEEPIKEEAVEEIKEPVIEKVSEKKVGLKVVFMSKSFIFLRQENGTNTFIPRNDTNKNVKIGDIIYL